MTVKGVVAAGHECTARAAADILRDGGNAFDAVVAAHCVACVAEPVLCSLGGGGFMMAHTETGKDLLYDFFVHTPQHRRYAAELDFHPITADFGTVQQEFHIGYGSVATPGSVKGLFAIHREQCTLPMSRLMEPAIALARDGITLNPLQAYIVSVVSPILMATTASRAIFASSEHDGPLRAGEVILQPQLADLMEALAREGDELFYCGDIARLIERNCLEHGGHLCADDLATYRVINRDPLRLRYRDAEVLTNPPPASGGLLTGFALGLLSNLEPARYAPGSGAFLERLAAVMALTNQARLETHLDEGVHPDAARLLDPNFLARYQQQVAGGSPCNRGTTHISVMDSRGNVASMTLSNGEGCGYILDGTGIMLNNMLGEQDLNPGGFHRWSPDQRMTSMMSPSIVFREADTAIALGSGGSNRIRTAILQVLVYLIDFHMPLPAAVEYPRIHEEGGLLNIEGGFEPDEIQALVADHANHRIWQERNLFFGGTHGVMRVGDSFLGAGDPRRGGSACVVT
jgi:gamma-glutamyltranspeptidase/glutathione hydrolase